MPLPADFSWQNTNILIADDEPDMREIFAAWLRNLGCTVTEVADGREALDMLSQNRFDAIVTDVRMPRLNGIQLARSLHDSGQYTPVVIFVSGFVDLPLPDAFDLGVEAVLSKPCTRQDLIRALKRSLQRRHTIFEPDPGIQPPAPEEAVHFSFPGTPATSPVAIGRGGMSMALSHPPEPGSAVGFSLRFAEGSLPLLSGWGLLQWREIISGRTRVGIEFMHLDPQCCDSFAHWVQSASPASFIPKEPSAQTAAKLSP